MKKQIFYTNNLNIIIIIISLSMIFITSCTDLEPELYSDLTTQNAYNTESDIDAGLTGVYANLAPYPGDKYLYYAGYLVMITDYATDMGFSTAGGDPSHMGNFSYNENNRYFSRNWQNMYQQIANANMLLSKIENIEMTEQKKNQIIGQAKFLRSLAYFDLTNAWGPVPLLTESINPSQSHNFPLSPVDVVDDLIIKDCEFAAEYLPSQWEPESGIGRVTRGAAFTLITKVYMRSHKYTKAKEYVDKVLELRNQGIYKLNPDFKNEWSDVNKVDMGLIFGIMSEATQNATEIANHFGPTDHPGVPNRWQYYGVSLDFWRKYSDLDPRKEFFYFNYEGRSPRDSNTEHGFYYMIPEKGQNIPPSDTVKLMRNVATKKYSYEMVSNSYLDGRTIQIFRLADVILAKAEIENELNGPSAALPYLNEIRSRAGAPEYGKHPDFPMPIDKEQMSKVILDERGFELVFEYKRKPDLVRFNRYTEICNHYLKERGLNPVVSDKMIYFPYPLQEAKIHSEMAEENLKRLP